MKSFTDRSPWRIGAVAIVIIAVLVSAVLVLNRSIFEPTYTIDARFASAAGIQPGAKVLVAGVPVGTVGAVKLDGNHVILRLAINHGVVLPEHTSAAIEVETVLGVEDVYLRTISGWSHPLRSGALITDTTTPVQLYQLENSGGHLLQKVNSAAFNQVVKSLAAITAGRQVQIREIIDGLAKISTTISNRQAQVGQLITAADSLSSTVASKDKDLSSVVTNLTTVLQGLAAHSGELAALISGLDQVGTQTDAILAKDRPQLNTLLAELHSILDVVAAHQLDLAEGVSYLGSGLKGFSSIGYSGPNDTPNSWANIYADLVTSSGTLSVLGSCGVVSEALNLALGPDPLPCSERTGPIPTGATSGASGLSSILAPVAGGQP
ncbi:MAG: MCE family protein [Actinobacteria bacterium]|nr:MCE family protein [Actinomycetota bacterium]